MLNAKAIADFLIMFQAQDILIVLEMLKKRKKLKLNILIN